MLALDSHRVVESVQDYFASHDGVRAVLLLGSFATGAATAVSDVDLLVIIEDYDEAILTWLQDARLGLGALLGRTISINCRLEAECLPGHAVAGIFQHRNRSATFILQAKYKSLVVIGSNPFAVFPDPSAERLRREAIVVVSSFAYQLRKFVLMPELAPHGSKEFVRTPLIILEYLCAFEGFFPDSSLEAEDKLVYAGVLEPLHVEFLAACRAAKASGGEIDHGLKLSSCRFADFAWKRMSSIYLDAEDSSSA